MPHERLLETARLFVRRITRADVDALLAVYGNADAMRFVGDDQPLDAGLRVARRRGATLTAPAETETLPAGAGARPAPPSPAAPV